MPAEANTSTAGRIAIRCECGNEFSAPVSKRGQVVYCLECDREQIVLESETLARIEQARNPRKERHVCAISFWIAVTGLFLGMNGITYLLDKSSDVPILFDLPSATGGMLYLLTGVGILFLGASVYSHAGWSRKGVLLFTALTVPGMVALIIYRSEWATFLSAGWVIWGSAVFLNLVSEEGRAVFQPNYRNLMRTRSAAWLSCLKSYFFWIPLVFAGLQVWFS